MKHDWNNLKIQFFKSDNISVSEFIRQKTGKETAKNNHIAKNVVWWKKEKNEYLKIKIFQANEEVDIKLRKKYKSIFEYVKLARMEWLEILSDRICINKDKLPTKELVNILKCFREENLIIDIDTQEKENTDPLKERLEQLRKAKAMNCNKD